MIKNRVVYLATPYSKYRGGIQQAFVDASRAAAMLMRQGNAQVFCPIAHSHPIAIYGHLDPLDHTIWFPLNETMLQTATELAVVRMKGWQDSIGVMHEIKTFRQMGKPVKFYELKDLGLSAAKEKIG